MPAHRAAHRTRALRSRAVTSVDALTPVDWHDGIAYKRDDLFLPFADIDLSGGKVRQALMLVERRLDEIVAEHGARLLTASSVHSPQGLIIARVAHHYGLACRLFIGATTARRAVEQHRLVALASQWADIDDTTGTGYETALAAMIDRWRAAHDGFPIRFGMNLDDDPYAIVGSTAEQTRNVPDEITTVVIPVGAGITAAGVIDGLRKHATRVDRIVLVQIAGHDRRKTINRITTDRDYEYVSDDRYPYARQIRRWAAPGLPLDPIYEAKAHEQMSRYLDVPRDQTLFWVVGNSAYVR